MCSMLIFTQLMLPASSAKADAHADALRITGETKYEPHSLVRLRTEGVDPEAAVLWRVYPLKDVRKATTPRELLEFAAKPGTYQVELLVITNTDGSLSVEEARVTVEIAGCAPVPPKPDPKPPGDGKLAPAAALGRIRFGSAGCTATVMGPRRNDGRWDVLTAAHCVSGVGQRGTLTLKDGRSFGIRVVTHHRSPDVAWCVTDDVVADLPYALLAKENPAPATAIWHMGFGVDRPGNREEGTVSDRENSQGQLRMDLSVSSGDSGGGIFRADTDELVSVVCCTSGIGRRVSMWGCSTEVATRTRPKPTADESVWVPVPIPIRTIGESDGDDSEDEWRPLPIPIRTIHTAMK